MVLPRGDRAVLAAVRVGDPVAAEAVARRVARARRPRVAAAGVVHAGARVLQRQCRQARHVPAAGAARAGARRGAVPRRDRDAGRLPSRGARLRRGAVGPVPRRRPARMVRRTGFRTEHGRRTRHRGVRSALAVGDARRDRRDRPRRGGVGPGAWRAAGGGGPAGRGVARLRLRREPGAGRRKLGARRDARSARDRRAGNGNRTGGLEGAEPAAGRRPGGRIRLPDPAGGAVAARADVARRRSRRAHPAGAAERAAGVHRRRRRARASRRSSGTARR